MNEGDTNQEGSIGEKLRRLLEAASELLRIAQIQERRLRERDGEEATG